MIKDYEMIKDSCEKSQVRFDPGLEEKTELAAQDFKMTAMTIHHNCIFMHWHNSYEIVLFNSGDAVCYIDGQRFSLSAGDIMFVSSGQIHAAYSVNNTELSFTPVIFDKSVFVGYPPDPDYSELIAPFLEDKLTRSNIIRKGDDQYNAICHIIKDIKKEYDDKSPGYRSCIKAYLRILMMKISKTLGFQEGKTNKRTQPALHDFKKLFEYLEDNYNEKITLTQASHIVNLSEYHFCKIFKEMTGLTFVRFLNLYRINAAEELLRNTSLTVTEISEKTGFCNINYFDRIFRQLKNYPPSKCRS